MSVTWPTFDTAVLLYCALVGGMALAMLGAVVWMIVASDTH